MENNSYIIRVALAEDINAPYIWLSSIPCNSREIVKLTNTNTSKTIWCEVVKPSGNYIERYNRNKRTFDLDKNLPFLVANEWYRNKLDLIKNEKANIKITISSKPLFIKQLLASYTHPDNSVRLATHLAFV